MVGVEGAGWMTKDSFWLSSSVAGGWSWGFFGTIYKVSLEVGGKGGTGDLGFFY